MPWGVYLRLSVVAGPVVMAGTAAARVPVTGDQEMAMTEPQFEILAADELDAIELGRTVLEGEADATVRVHPWVEPGMAIIINKAAIPDLTIGPFRVVL